MGFCRISPIVVLALALTGPACAQDVLNVPASGNLVDVLRDSFDAPDAQTRYESVCWIRSRTTPAAFQVLRRASRDPVPAIAFEGLMGLAQIAREYELESYQMRHLPAEARAELIRRASTQELIGLPSLRAIATDSSAEPLERTEALLAMRAMGETPRPSLWLPMLGATDERVRLHAALAIVTETPRIRAVAVAQEHATNIVRQSVRDASKGKVSAVVDVLTEARRAPSASTGDWCLALISSCAKGETPEQRIVAQEALRTLITIAPSTAHPYWKKLTGFAAPEDASKVAYWALEAAATLHSRGVPIPAWLAELPHRADPKATEFVSSASRAIAAMAQTDHSPSAALADVVMTGGPAARSLGVRQILDLPEHDRSPAIAALLTRAAGSALESEYVMELARDLASIDPIAAQVTLETADPDSVVGRCLILAGVWSPACRDDSSLGLLRALYEAEQEIEGARTRDRSALAAQMELIIERPEAFSAAIRAEAAWLAIVLRDQSSEAMAMLPTLSPVYDGDLSLELEQADSLLQWAQMPYP